MFAPLSGHFATLLRDTVRTLLPDHDVWITDWIDAKEVPVAEGPFHFDDYVDYVREFLRFVGPQAHSISVCQPTVPVLAAVSLMAAAGEKLPRSLTMMGGPIDTRASPTAVNDFAQFRPMSWFESKVVQRVPMRYPGFMRRVYPGFMQFAGFVAMNPDRHFDSHVQYYHHLIQGDGSSAESHRRFYDEYNAVMDLPAEYYLETVERVFHKHLLPKGQLKVRGERVRPEAIRGTALFTIEGEIDDISGPGADAGGAPHVQGHSREGEAALPRARRGPLRHLLRPQVPRDDLPEDPRLHRHATTSRSPIMAKPVTPHDMFDLWQKMVNPGAYPLQSLMFPVLDAKELDKKIAELETVEHWLKANLNMLQLSIKSLEYQRQMVKGGERIKAAMDEGRPPESRRGSPQPRAVGLEHDGAGRHRGRRGDGPRGGSRGRSRRRGGAGNRAAEGEGAQEEGVAHWRSRFVHSRPRCVSACGWGSLRRSRCPCRPGRGRRARRRSRAGSGRSCANRAPWRRRRTR